MTTEELQLGIGTEEAVTLKPEKVIPLAVSIEEVGTKKAKKVIITCKHPGKEEPIKISSVKFESKGKLETSGLWLNKDSKGLIRKGSGLATFLQHNGANAIGDLTSKKELETTTDDKGYLCFKAY